MKARLKELAAVHMGYSFRSRLESAGCAGVSVIQMKNLLDDNTVSCERLMQIEMDVVKEQYLAQKGDLIFRSRGQVTTSAILVDNPGMALVAAPLLRIRVYDSGKILPEYLNWYISQKEAQVYLTSRSEGTAVKKISKKELEDMVVSVPSLKTQKDIIELASLSAREHSLLCMLAHKKEQHISAVLMQMAKGE